jgi:CBS domain-containing protein
MLAGEIAVRNIVTIRAGSSLAAAAEVLLAHQINAMPVVDAAGRLVGMIGIRDVLRVPKPSHSDAHIIRWDHFGDRAKLLAQTPVDIVMTRQVRSACEETDVNDIIGMMVDRGIHPIPVLRDGHLTGIIGRADIARAMLALVQGAGADEEGASTAAAPADIAVPAGGAR